MRCDVQVLYDRYQYRLLGGASTVKWAPGSVNPVVNVPQVGGHTVWPTIGTGSTELLCPIELRTVHGPDRTTSLYISTEVDVRRKSTWSTL